VKRGFEILVFFLSRQPRNFQNMTWVARQRMYFWGVLSLFLVVQLPPKRGVLVHKNSLASCQRCSHSVESRALTCPFKQSNLSEIQCNSLELDKPTSKVLLLLTLYKLKSTPKSRMYLDHEGNCKGKISPSWGQPNTRVHIRTIYYWRVSDPGFLSFFLGFRRPNLITGLSGWWTPDYPLRTQEPVPDRRTRVLPSLW